MVRILELGSDGDDVKFLQDRLNEALPSALSPLLVDGDFGPVTLGRVNEYQGDHRLAVNGVVGPVTWTNVLGHTVAETPGFFVLGRQFYDYEGTRVLLRGVNKMSVFEQQEDQVGQISFPEIKKTGANTVRIVWRKAVNDPPESTDPEVLKGLIHQAKTNRLIPMIELHDATGDWSKLDELVDYWEQKSKMLTQHDQYLLLNIGNEVGDWDVTRSQFVEGYTSAVQRLRAVGIKTPW